MTKIAEAWGELERAIMQEMDGTGTLEGPMAAARALALAVLEDLEATEGRDYERGLGRFECDFESIREEINKLGEKAND